jgi:hypothetical protein
MARNAEVLFWSNLPMRWLAAAALPHAGFIALQAAWRLARGRHRPFFRGKLDALALLLPELGSRRRFRHDLARRAANRPHFPLTLTSLGDARDHLRRPGVIPARRA